MTQHWCITLPKGDAHVVIYTTTTDDAVNRDLDETDEHSLICRARQFHRHPQTREQDHRDLAIGALMAYATEPPFNRSCAKISRCNSVPRGEPITHVGGRRADLLPVWEELDEAFGVDVDLEE